jgi:hypothetical protein
MKTRKGQRSKSDTNAVGKQQKNRTKKPKAKNKKGAPKKLRCASQAKPKTKKLKPEKNLATPTKKP